MKVSVLSHDLSHNCVGRAYVIARLVGQFHQVEIVGPAIDGSIWEPLSDQRDVPMRRLDVSSVKKMARQVDGDVLYAIKPQVNSLGIALAARDLIPRPLLADVDDWELGFFLDNPKWMARNLVDLRSRNNVYRTAAMERRVKSADAITVSSKWLADRFNGTVIVHARDTEEFDPSRFVGEKVRDEIGAGGKKVILFLGSVRPHKGLGSLIRAIDSLKRDDVIFLVVGGNSGLPDRPYLKVLGRQPFNDIPKFLAAADIVVLPQEDSFATRAQMPAKVYDAMAMGRPTIVSDVADLAETVAGGGVVVSPGDVVALASALQELLNNRPMREAMGAAARLRCTELYSFKAVAPTLESLITRTVVEWGRKARNVRQ